MQPLIISNFGSFREFKGKGKPQGIYTFQFNAKATDFYYHLIYELVKNVFNPNDLKNKNKLEVYLDISIGINFMPVFTYRAVKEILELLAMFIDEVYLYVYNSDPLVGNATNELNINLVEKTQIKGNPFNTKIKSGNYIIPYKDIKDVNYFIGSIYNGLPLAIYTFFPEIELDRILDKTFEKYLKEIDITVDDKNVLIDKKLSLDFSFKFTSIAYLLVSLFKQNRIINRNEEEVCFSKLKNLTKNFFKFDQRLENRIFNELKSIERNFKRYKNEGNSIPQYQLLAIINRINCKTRSFNNGKQKRNFLAHSGINYCVVQIKEDSCRRNLNLKLRYDPDKNRRSEIKQIVLTGLLENE
jgi:CRISPR-associated protein Csx1